VESPSCSPKGAVPLEWLTELEAALPAGRLVIDPDILEGHRKDEAGLVPAGHPAALVRPQSTAEVQAILRVADRHRVSVVPRGAGTGLAGGANALDGCLVLSLMAMNRIVEIDPRAMVAVVQPGLVNAALGEAARAVGLWYSPDPASYESCTIGGNVATNAGGLCCVKYGVTRESVLALEVVLANGEVLRTGARTLKRAAGYDLTRLFIGSEGTLGVVTEVTVRLRPKKSTAVTLVASFPTLESAGEAITTLVGRMTPSLLELMDRRTTRAVEDWKPMGLDTSAAATLFASTDTPGEEGKAELELMASLCQAAGAGLLVHSSEPAEAEALMAARRLCYPALERLGSTLLDDVAVPISMLPAMLAAIERVSAEHRVTVGTFGHAGDGNLHPTIVFDAADAESTARAQRAFDGIVHAALSMGGTVSGEHGVGLLKRGHLSTELGETGVSVQWAIKRALDPHGILNPGKILAHRSDV
jgi:glycolate oxidase